MNQAEQSSSTVRLRIALRIAWWHRLGVLCLICCSAAITLPAQTNFTSLYSFCYLESYCPPPNPTGDGARPYAGLVQGLDGNFYGTTEYGGAETCDGGCGTVFKILSTSPYTVTTLYSFCSLTNCADGATPTAGLTLGTDGNFYGTTISGGTSKTSCGGGGSGGCGTVFKITPAGELTTLHSFCLMSNCTDGEEPYGGLIQAVDGNFYGTTTFGGANVGSAGGTLFKITPTGTLTTLYSFCSLAGCADGANPYDSLAQGTDGNLYGLTKSGGKNGVEGTPFKMNPRGPMLTLSNPSCSQNCGYGNQPFGGMVQATNGDFYMTVTSGGADDCGTILEMTPTGTVTLLHTFTGGDDGCYPYDSLIQGTDGNFYGTASGGAAVGMGTVFEVTPTGTLTTLFQFGSISGGAEGAGPLDSLLQATNGTFYGTTASGGTIGWGTVFSLNNGLSAFVAAKPNFGLWGASIDILGSGFEAFPITSVSFNGTPATFEVASDSEIVATVPAGATTGEIQVVQRNSPTMSSAVNFRVLPPLTTLGLTTNYAGGGAADVAVWRADTGSWYMKPASGAQPVTVFQGLPGDIPVIGDFDGDGKTDYGVWRPDNATFYVILSSTGKTVTQQWGETGDVPVPSDYDGDGKTDYAVWRPSNATWYIIPSTGGPDIVYQWGATDDVPVIGDYDGDGKADYGVWNPATGTWSVSLSAGGTISQVWGEPGDIPVEADYDGDGMTDFAVWRPSTGWWYIMPSSGIPNIAQQWGMTGDIPAVGDYNSDGKSDYAVFRPSNGTWYINYSSGGTKTVQWGETGDVPAVHLPVTYRRDQHIPNFDGDQRTDIGVFRPSNGTWYVIDSSTGKSTSQAWGEKGDIIVPGDYVGDGKTDYAIWRPSTASFYVIPSNAPLYPLTQQLGVSTDIPVPGDYDGDGKTDYAVWSPSTGTFTVILSSTGKTVTQQLGISGDIPVPGDYDGDGKTDYAIWRPSTGTFYVILSSTGESVNQQWGANGDIPVPGDYDGDGRTDYAVWQPSTGTFYVILSSTGKTVSQAWGASGDVPVPKDYDGDGKTDFAVWRPSNGTWYIINLSTGISSSTPWGANGDVPLSTPTGQLVAQ